MTKVCILTDNSAQFPSSAFSGKELINIIPIGVKLNGFDNSQNGRMRLRNFPSEITTDSKPIIIHPSVQLIKKEFVRLENKYDQIVAIFQSDHLSNTMSNAREALRSLGGGRIEVIDSNTTATGLGLLVEAAAIYASQGYNSFEIKRMIIGKISRTYSVFFMKGLSYLSNAGILDEAQAKVGEMLGIAPFYVVEHGKFIPMWKIRSKRHLLDSIYEFVMEFNNVKHIGFIQGYPPFEKEVKTLRERLVSSIPVATISEHTIHPSLAAIVGPQTLGMFVLDEDETVE